MMTMKEIAEKSRQQQAAIQAAATAPTNADLTPDPDTAPTLSELDKAFGPKDKPAEPHGVLSDDDLKLMLRRKFVDQTGKEMTMKDFERATGWKTIEAARAEGIGAKAILMMVDHDIAKLKAQGEKTAPEMPAPKPASADKEVAGSGEPVTNLTGETGNDIPERIDKAQFRNERTIDIKGKKYLKAADRVVLWRADHPDWTLETEAVQLSPSFAVFKAMVKDETGKLLATAHGYCSPELAKQVSGRFVEKAETAAVARALSFVGYGTDDSLDDSDYLSDSPVRAA